MALLNLSPSPGLYTSDQTITVTGAPSVSRVIMTKDGSDPVIVKTIAASSNYVPDKPYMQTIEDGRGRAVFDGAFTKYYNMVWNSAGNANGAPASFAQLHPNFKYLYNALNFLRSGGTKWLILGDASITDRGEYRVKGTAEVDFYTSFTSLAAFMGLSLTVKESNDYGGILNATYAELIGYDVIFVMSSMSGPGSDNKITAACAANIAAVRRAGRGVYVCTDHNVFTDCANSVVGAITNAQFEGVYDFSPGTTVNYNRAVYGDSPLFVGMAGTDILTGSGSDSSVSQVAQPTQALPVSTGITSGYTTLKFAIVDTGGNVTFEQYGYNIGQPPIVELVNDVGTTIENWPETCLRKRSVKFKYLPGSFGNSSGFILVNNTVVAEFSNQVSGPINASWVTTPYSDAGVPNVVKMGPGQNYNVVVSLVDPVVFEYAWNFNRFIPSAPTVDYHKFIAQVNRNEFAGPPTVINPMVKAVPLIPGLTLGLTLRQSIQKLYDEMK